MSHTPGPWTLEDRGYTYIIRKPGNGYITRDVCRMDSSTMAAFEQKANAKLIVAAPELLATLVALLGSLEEHAFDHNDSIEARERALAAIAKATP